MDHGVRNTFMLATAQALMLSAVVVSMTLAGIIGTLLSPDRGLATLPIAAMVVGHLLVGGYQGFANDYRFTAAEAAGPQIAVWGRDWLAQSAFLGSYFAQAGLSVAAMPWPGPWP